MGYNRSFLRRELLTSLTTWMMLSLWLHQRTKQPAWNLNSSHLPDIPGHWGWYCNLTSADKLFRLKLTLSHCLSHRFVTKHLIQSLTGLLQFATKVIRPGCSFMCQLHVLQSIGSHPNHHICLNPAARADITWRLEWCLHVLGHHNYSASVHSCLWCFRLLGLWSFLGQLVVPSSMAGKLPASLYCHEGVNPCHHRSSSFWLSVAGSPDSDNTSVLHVLNSTYSKDPHLLHLIHILVFLEAHFEFWFQAWHIANLLADALSRNNMALFTAQTLQSLDHSSDIPAVLVSLLGSIYDWTSPIWIQLFRDTLRQLWLLHCKEQMTRYNFNC